MTKSIKYHINSGNEYLYVIRSDFNEITNSRILNQLKTNLKNNKFIIWTNHERITSDLIFIKKFVSQINVLYVDAGGLTSNDMEKIKYKLSSTNIKVSFIA